MLKLSLGVLTAAYPLLVYFGQAYFRLDIFGLLLLAIVLLRFTNLDSSNKRKLMIPILIAVVYSIAIAITGNETLLRFYPVFTNILMLVVFASTLLNPPTMIARFAAMRGTRITPEVKYYVDKVTVLWCGFFILNAGIASYTALYSSLKTWALYNGLLVYIVVGLLLVLELCTRTIYKKRIANSAKPGNTVT